MDDEGMALLRRMAEDLRVIREIVEAGTVDDWRLLTAISTVVDAGEAFTVGDLFDRSYDNEALGAAIGAVAGDGPSAPEKLGKRLRSMRPRQIGPYRLEAGPATREGRVWSFARVRP